MEIVTWNIPISNGKTENSLLEVWFWGSVSHFRSRPFVTGSYILCYLLQIWKSKFYTENSKGYYLLQILKSKFYTEN